MVRGTSNVVDAMQDLSYVVVVCVVVAVVVVVVIVVVLVVVFVVVGFGGVPTPNARCTVLQGCLF